MMKIHKTLLAACVAGSLLQVTTGRGNSQEIAFPVQQSRIDSSFKNLKTTEAGGERSITTQQKNARAFRRAGVITPKSAAITHKGLSGGRKFAINEPVMKMRSIASSSSSSRNVGDDFEASLKTSKAGSGKVISRSSIDPNARTSKFSLKNDERSIRSDIFSQMRVVK